MKPKQGLSHHLCHLKRCVGNQRRVPQVSRLRPGIRSTDPKWKPRHEASWESHDRLLWTGNQGFWCPIPCPFLRRVGYHASRPPLSLEAERTGEICGSFPLNPTLRVPLDRRLGQLFRIGAIRPRGHAGNSAQQRLARHLTIRSGKDHLAFRSHRRPVKPLREQRQVVR
jgi:hypothetical protein